ncbi:unnamed protein product, partial [Mesorhabditis spiculigera]
MISPKIFYGLLLLQFVVAPSTGVVKAADSFTSRQLTAKQLFDLTEPDQLNETDGNSTDKLPVDQAVRDKLNEAVSESLSGAKVRADAAGRSKMNDKRPIDLTPPYGYTPAAVHLGKLTGDDWWTVYHDLQRYEALLEQWRINKGKYRSGSRGNCIETNQIKQLTRAIFDWLEASSKEWRRYAHVWVCDGSDDVIWGWRCLEPALCWEVRKNEEQNICVVFYFIKGETHPGPNATLVDEQSYRIHQRTTAEIWLRTENRKPQNGDLMRLDTLDEFVPNYFVHIHRHGDAGFSAAQETGHALYCKDDKQYDRNYEVEYRFFF